MIGHGMSRDDQPWYVTWWSVMVCNHAQAQRHLKNGKQNIMGRICWEQIQSECWLGVRVRQFNISVTCAGSRKWATRLAKHPSVHPDNQHNNSPPQNLTFLVTLLLGNNCVIFEKFEEQFECMSSESPSFSWRFAMTNWGMRVPNDFVLFESFYVLFIQRKHYSR